MKKNIILFLICILFIVAPFVISSQGEFEGADSQAEVLINEIDSDYEPWVSNLWEPPSGEVESFLFAMQAAIGAGFIGFFIGLKKNVKGSKSI